MRKDRELRGKKERICRAIDTALTKSTVLRASRRLN